MKIRYFFKTIYLKISIVINKLLVSYMKFKNRNLEKKLINERLETLRICLYGLNGIYIPKEGKEEEAYTLAITKYYEAVKKITNEYVEKTETTSELDIICKKPTREERANMSKEELLRAVWLLDDYADTHGWHIRAEEGFPEPSEKGFWCKLQDGRYEVLYYKDGFYYQHGSMDIYIEDDSLVVAWKRLTEIAV